MVYRGPYEITLTPEDYENLSYLQVQMWGGNGGSNACTAEGGGSEATGTATGCLNGGTGGMSAYLDATFPTLGRNLTLGVGGGGEGGFGSRCDPYNFTLATSGGDSWVIGEGLSLRVGGGQAPMDYPIAGGGGMVIDTTGAKSINQMASGNEGLTMTCKSPCTPECSGTTGGDGMIIVYFLPDEIMTTQGVVESKKNESSHLEPIVPWVFLVLLI